MVERALHTGALCAYYMIPQIAEEFDTPPSLLE